MSLFCSPQKIEFTGSRIQIASTPGVYDVNRLKVAGFAYGADVFFQVHGHSFWAREASVK
jgi:hypothetical protein